MIQRGILRLATAILLGVIGAGPAVTWAGEGVEVDLVTHSGVLIHASPARIWPKILDPNEWKAGARLIAIEGTAEQPSARFKAVMPDTPDQVAFYVRNVEVIPQRRRTMRLNLPDRTLIGFASLELSPTEHGTLVEYHVYSLMVFPEASLAGMTAEERVAFRTDYQASNAQRFQNELKALKNLVESLTAK